MITTVLAGAAALSAVLAIAAEWEERRHPAFYLLKPLTTALILAVVLTLAPSSGAAYRQWVLVALALSLVGDICLMFKGDLWFAGGLGSFLVAHLFFILAFAGGVTLAWPPPWTALLVLYGLGLGAWLLPRAGALRIPVAVYCLVLLGMALSAALRLDQLGSRPALLASAALAPAGLAPAALAVCGSIVFMLSDSLLAIRQFGGPYRGAQALILSTYWAAIGLIAASV
jgi:alkenylglycerophosphocholine hydrolase